MLITNLKSNDDILSLISKNTLVVSCEGCKEVYFPEDAAAAMQKELLEAGTVSAVITTDYICNPENLELQCGEYRDSVTAAENILVFSCGVGVQTAADVFPDKRVFAACDTYPLPGYQGVTPLEVDCAQCGDCHLNDTGGICPITACSKSLINGQCGGAKGGKCEVDKDMDCGWELIYRRLKNFNHLDTLSHQAKIRNFSIKESQ